MTETETAKTIIKQNGYCGDIDCSDCPAYRIHREKGLESCTYLWYYNNDNKKIWFESWLKELKMTEIEVANIILKENCHCLMCSCYDGFSCNYCPAFKVYREKGFFSCIDLWSDNDYKKKEWFENFLIQNNGDKMKTEKIKELREKLKNITDDQLETIADIIYNQVVDDEQHIIDAYNVFYSESCFTYKEDLFAKKISTGGDYPKVFYAGFKAAEKMYKK